MKIRLADIVADTYTNSSGLVLYTFLKSVLNKNEIIELSFRDISAPSSSFLNSSFGSLIEEIGLENFLVRIKPKEVTATQAKMLKHYIHGFKNGRASV
ncbi:STAS-like domain-containing protein [Aquiflexum sp. LQ15W]|uniref:STAS-like domain-containing protein n=1 Tax=Cognataquiflexum nitidum TaxID=2922272 RepID=UPI001F148064|nr:STAS-like domain-containing protein [Cognataquiflexum nitidum]MCH6200120.1 STAS-like domain-containing protein [Cognataquiflexum nitidum]